MLDNVIDINYYSVPQAQNSNFKHRPVGLGIMGFQDALYLQHIPYGSTRPSPSPTSPWKPSATTRSRLPRPGRRARRLPDLQGSLWSQGIRRSTREEADRRARRQVHRSRPVGNLDWLRERVQKGIRNSNIMAIAPTATIANITGVSQSIEPTYQNLYVKSNPPASSP